MNFIIKMRIFFRDICDRARKGCGPILEKYQVDWPELLQCETFPWFSDRPCLHFNKSKDVSANESEKPLTSTTNKAMKTKPLKPAHTRSIQFNLTQSTTVSNEDQCTCHCHHPMILLSDPQDPLYNQVKCFLNYIAFLIIEWFEKSLESKPTKTKGAQSNI